MLREATIRKFLKSLIVDTRRLYKDRRNTSEKRLSAELPDKQFNNLVKHYDYIDWYKDTAICINFAFAPNFKVGGKLKDRNVFVTYKWATKGGGSARIRFFDIYGNKIDYQPKYSSLKVSNDIKIGLYDYLKSDYTVFDKEDIEYIKQKELQWLIQSDMVS